MRCIVRVTASRTELAIVRTRALVLHIHDIETGICTQLMILKLFLAFSRRPDFIMKCSFSATRNHPAPTNSISSASYT